MLLKMQKKESGLIILCLLMLPFKVAGNLEQLNASHPICPGDIVVFRCSNYVSGFVNWDLRATNRRSYAVSFSNVFNNIGSSQNGFLGNFLVSFSVDFSNESAMVSSIRMANIGSLNGTNITCNGQKITLWVGVFDQFLPSELQVKQFAESYDFILTWQPGLSAESNPYNVEIYSLYDHQSVTTSTNAAYVKLDNTSVHNVTFHTTFCMGIDSQKTFMLGVCPFLVFHNSIQVQYNILSTSNVSVSVTCADGNEISFLCGKNKKWSTGIDQICNTTDSVFCNNEKQSKRVFNITEEKEAILLTTTNLHSQHCLSVITAFTGGFVGATVISVFTILFILGLLRYRSIRKNNTINTVEGDANKRSDPHSKETLYEDIQTAHAFTGFTVSENAAYGEVKVPIDC